MLIFVENKTPRVLYITDFVMRQLLGYELLVTDNIDLFTKSRDAKINYSSSSKSDNEFFLPPHLLLFQTDISEQDTNITIFFDLVCFFKSTNPKSDFPFDIFAAAFWLLSRYEEYLPCQKDIHGRYVATSSLAYQENFLHLPIIQLWAKKFSFALKKVFPKISENQQKKFQFKPSYDIDMAWAYRQKGILRTIGGALQDLRNGRFSKFSKRISVLTNQKDDPFDSFSFLEELHQKYNIHPIFFFLLGDFGAFDKNTKHTNKKLASLVQKIHQKHNTGIHPSYASNEKENQVTIEINRLTQITQEKTIRSRQHFLRLSFPKTYQRLLENGIKEDYSMGYAADIGFRAGVGVPFYWYDLEKEEKTDLLIYPFQVMDVTLRHYLKLNPEKAFIQVKKIIQTMKSVGGTFMTLWHNSSFSEEDGWDAEWKDLYVKIIEESLKMKKDW